MPFPKKSTRKPCLFVFTVLLVLLSGIGSPPVHGGDAAVAVAEYRELLRTALVAAEHAIVSADGCSTSVEFKRDVTENGQRFSGDYRARLWSTPTKYRVDVHAAGGPLLFSYIKDSGSVILARLVNPAEGAVDAKYDPHVLIDRASKQALAQLRALEPTAANFDFSRARYQEAILSILDSSAYSESRSDDEVKTSWRISELRVEPTADNLLVIEVSATNSYEIIAPDSPRFGMIVPFQEEKRRLVFRLDQDILLQEFSMETTDTHDGRQTWRGSSRRTYAYEATDAGYVLKSCRYRSESEERDLRRTIEEEAVFGEYSFAPVAANQFNVDSLNLPPGSPVIDHVRNTTYEHRSPLSEEQLLRRAMEEPLLAVTHVASHADTAMKEASYSPAPSPSLPETGLPPRKYASQGEPQGVEEPERPVQNNRSERIVTLMFFSAAAVFLLFFSRKKRRAIPPAT